MQRALDLIALDETVRQHGEGMRTDVLDGIVGSLDQKDPDLSPVDRRAERLVLFHLSHAADFVPCP